MAPELDGSGAAALAIRAEPNLSPWRTVKLIVEPSSL